MVFSAGMWPQYQPLLRADFRLFDEYCVTAQQAQHAQHAQTGQQAQHVQHPQQCVHSSSSCCRAQPPAFCSGAPSAAACCCSSGVGGLGQGVQYVGGQQGVQLFNFPIVAFWGDEDSRITKGMVQVRCHQLGVSLGEFGKTNVEPRTPTSTCSQSASILRHTTRQPVHCFLKATPCYLSTSCCAPYVSDASQPRAGSTLPPLPAATPYPSDSRKQTHMGFVVLYLSSSLSASPTQPFPPNPFQGWRRFTSGPFELVRMRGAKHLWPCGGDKAAKRAWLEHIVQRLDGPHRT